MATDKKDWTNDSDEINMDWATESETQEAQEELNRREAEDQSDEKKQQSAAPAAGAPKAGTAPKGGRGGSRGRGGARSGRGGRGSRGDHPRESGRGYGGEVSSNAIYMSHFPASWKEAEVRKFFTTGVKEAVEESQIEKIRVFSVKSGVVRAVIYFKSTDSYQKGLKANKTKVENDEVHIEPYSDRGAHTSSSYRSGGRRSTAPSSAKESSGSARPTVRENPFGAAHANDTSMKLERERIEAENKGQKEVGEVAPATADKEAAAPAPAAEGEAKPAAEGEAKPAAEGETKPAVEGEAKPEAPAPAAAAPAKKPETKKAAAASAAADKQKQKKDDKKKALLKQQKEREKKKKAEEAEKKKKEKTFDPFGGLDDE